MPRRQLVQLPRQKSRTPSERWVLRPRAYEQVRAFLVQKLLKTCESIGTAKDFLKMLGHEQNSTPSHVLVLVGDLISGDELVPEMLYMFAGFCIL